MKRAWVVLAVIVAASCASLPPPTTRVEAPTFAIALASEPEVSTARATNVSLVLEGRGGFHVNLEYPLRVELSGSAAQLDKTSFGPADATQLSEERARFDVPVRFTSAGKQKLTARVLFAVCTPASCVPAEKTLALELNVR